MAITTNLVTGVEYNINTGDSTKRYVAVEDNGVIRDSSGGKWPYQDGGVHKEPYDYYEVVPFAGAGYDSDKFYIENRQVLESYIPKPPAGYPQGTYKTIQTLHLLPKADLKDNALRRFQQAQSRVWPQDASYDKVLTIAQKALNSPGSSDPEIGSPELFVEIVERDARIEAALINNTVRLAELNKEIDKLQVDENGDLKLDANGQVITPPNSIEFDRMWTADNSGWVNGVA
jgi:hypothetical protein